MRGISPQNIRNLRIKMGLTQSDVAKTFGITRAAVGRWETGKAQPRTELLMDLAYLYNCRIDDLFF